MNIIDSILTKNPCYTANRKITVKGLMLHSVGCAQPNASVFVKNWNSPSHTNSCVHAFIDAKTGDVYQCLPWNHRGWHGGGSSNNTHIGVEMCEPECIKYIGGATFTCSNFSIAQERAKTTYNSAVKLFAKLCREFNLDPLGDGVIVSHKEGYKRGIASGHADPEHLWTQLKLPYTMDTFRRDVNKELTSTYVPAYIDTSSEKVEFKPYLVKVTASELNIRKGPGTSYGINGSIKDKGVYTIVAREGSWGKLKSGAGWISLNYTRVL